MKEKRRKKKNYRFIANCKIISTNELYKINGRIRYNEIYIYS